ncbi:unnamed protein product, partial [Ectocarpus sp. 13 AM-2016]
MTQANPTFLSRFAASPYHTLSWQRYLLPWCCTHRAQKSCAMCCGNRKEEDYLAVQEEAIKRKLRLGTKPPRLQQLSSCTPR